jgi:hypothetical protein
MDDRDFLARQRVAAADYFDRAARWNAFCGGSAWQLAAVAAPRWTIEECFQSAKGETGLDHCEARSCTPGIVA